MIEATASVCVKCNGVGQPRLKYIPKQTREMFFWERAELVRAVNSGEKSLIEEVSDKTIALITTPEHLEASCTKCGHITDRPCKDAEAEGG